MFGFDPAAEKRGIFTIFVGLFLTTLIPIINIVRLVPFLKEIVLATFAVAIFTPLTEPKPAVKYALATGMSAAALINLLYFGVASIPPLSNVVFATARPSIIVDGLGGIGALTNLLGFLVLSPIGYILGGTLGSILNH